ncbi:MAG: GGDEF domain-containing protein [Acidimicrobiia bacterium]|nr:GGDEF domain-containing protein [Acidimicrobiia bacterium]
MHWTSDPRRAAQYAAYAFAVVGVITILGALGNRGVYERVGGSTTWILVAGGSALLIAAFIPVLPWKRWGPRATLSLPMFGLAVLAVSEMGSKSGRTGDGVMGTATIITLVFVWIGLTQPRWWSFILTPVVAAVIVMVFSLERADVSVTTLVTGIALSAIIGELVAWVKHGDEVRSDELGLVIDGTSGLRNDHDRGAAARRLAETVVSLLRIPNVGVYLDGPGGEYVLTAKTGPFSWPATRAVEADTGLSVSAIDAEVELVIPLVGRAGGLRGVVVASGRRRQDEFMLRLAQILGEQAGYRLDDLDALDALTDETRRDALTSIGNRRHGDEVLKTLRPLDLVVVIDLDDLRGINAARGHQGGDTAIRSVATYLSEAIREGDAVARMGGDEFVIVMRDVGPEAFGLIERLARDWNDAHPDASFSAGAAVFGGGDPEVTLRAADAALFDAKREGRARASLSTASVSDDGDAGGSIRDASGF